MKNKTFSLPGIFKRRTGSAFAALLLSASLTGCDFNGGCGFGDEVKPDILPCSTLVTVIAAGCASGAFQNYWLELENGELLQPYENNTEISKIEPGQRYLIGYEEMRPDKRYDGHLACLALPPDGTPVRILCMSPEGTTPASPELD